MALGDGIGRNKGRKGYAFQKGYKGSGAGQPCTGLPAGPERYLPELLPGIPEE